jgi:L-amino acid N-acyltransferase YncA
MITIRDSQAGDLDAITAIYAHHVQHGVATFEEVPPPREEMAARREAYLRAGMPYLVAADGDEVVGYAYAGPYRARSAYRFTVENSVYLRADRLGRGTGSRLLAELIQRCERGGFRQMIAVITGGEMASLRLHAKHGFAETGVIRAVGLKFGRWHDTHFLQRELGEGARTLPS